MSDQSSASILAETKAASLPSPGPVYDPYVDAEVSLLSYLNILLRRWRLVLGMPLLAAFVAGITSLLIAPTFRLEPRKRSTSPVLSSPTV